MDVEMFLRRGNIGVGDILTSLNDYVGLQEDDLVLAVGSLTEGLGSVKSDLDIWVITHDLRPQIEDHLAMVVGKSLIDVQIYSRQSIDKLLLLLSKWTSSSWEVSLAAKFSQDDLQKLHRLLMAQNFRKLSETNVPRPLVGQVALLKLHMARQAARTVQVDLIGYRECSDWRSLSFAAQALLGNAVDALLAGYLLTNPLPKWRNRLLERLSDAWAAPLLIHPTKNSASGWVWHLHQTPIEPEMHSCYQHALRISTFARAVFWWAQSQLVEGLAGTYWTPNWNFMKPDPDGRPLPHWDLDVDFRVVGATASMGRLNAFQSQASMSLESLAMFLLHNGFTTERQAQQAVFGSEHFRHSPQEELAMRELEPPIL